MRSLLTLIVLSVLAVSSAGADTTIVVLDNSAGMWRPLDDGMPRFVAARLALASWRAALQPNHRVGLRLAGGSGTISDLSTCTDTRAGVPVAELVWDDWHSALMQLVPGGQRGLLTAVAAAIEDLGTDDGNRTVIIVTSGEDECDGPSASVAAALESGVQFRVLVLAAESSVVERFGAVAPTRNPNSHEAILTALRWAADLDTEEPPAPATFVGDTGGFSAVQSARLEHAITREAVDLTVTNEIISGQAVAGIYSAIIEDGISGHLSVDGIPLLAGRETSVSLDLAPPPVVALDVDPSPAEPGSTVFVTVVGAPRGENWISLAPAESPTDGWITRLPVAGPDDTLEIRTPELVGDFEIRLHERVGDGLDRLAASSPIQLSRSDIEITAPTETGRLEPVAVQWSGPDNPDDFLAFGRPGEPSTRFSSCAAARSGSPSTLVAPTLPGMWEIRYITGQTGAILGRATVEVMEESVTLEAPAETTRGLPLEIFWDGPAGDADYISVAAQGTDGTEYLSLALAELGSPARLTAPDTVGLYEIRYVRGHDGRILKRAALTVEETTPSLEAPAKVVAGSRISVRWTGPDLAGDFIAIANRGSGPYRYLDFAYTSAGSPASLAAPFRPGRFEIRYISGDSKEVLAAIPVRVVR